MPYRWALAAASWWERRKVMCRPSRVEHLASLADVDLVLNHSAAVRIVGLIILC